MSVSAEPVEVGPADALAPIGDKVVTTTPTGSKIVRVDYEDGSIFQLQVRRGSSFHGQTLFADIPAGRLMSVSDPVDVGDNDDPDLYISVWVPNN